MEDLHSHSLRDTDAVQTERLEQQSIQPNSIMTIVLVMLLLASIVMVMFYPESIFGRGALALSILALSGILSAKSKHDGVSVYRTSNFTKTDN